MSWLLYPITYPISFICGIVGGIFGLFKQHRLADRIFTIAVKLTPHYSLALWSKGISSRMSGDYNQALYYYTESIAIKVRNPKIYYFRGLCYAELKQYSNAIEDYNTVLALKPSFGYLVYIQRGLIFLNLRQYHAALADFTMAQRLKPTKLEPFIDLAATCVRLKDYRRAIDYSTQATNLKSSHALVYCNRGVAYFYLGNYQQAEADYRKAIQLDPKFALTYANLADLNLRIKNYKYAVELCDQALKLDPKLVVGYNQRAIAHLFQSHLTEAVADLAQSQRLDATDLQASTLRFWLSLGTTPPSSDVIIYLKSLADTNPHDYHAQVLQAISEGLSGKWDTCLYQLRAAWATENDDIFYPFWVGLAYAFLHQDQEALAALTYAVQQTVPGPLLNPLHWLQTARPDFYQQHILALLKKFGNYSGGAEG